MAKGRGRGGPPPHVRRAQAQAKGAQRAKHGGPAPAGARRYDSVAALRAGAIDLHQKGKAAEAMAAYRKYLLARPDDAGIWSNYGVALREAGHWPAAEACYRRGLELTPDDAGLLGNLGNVLKDMDRLDEAIASHEAGLALKPDDARLRHNYGIALREAARYEDALAAFDAVLAATRDDPVNQAKVGWDRAMVLLHLNRSADAWQAYECRVANGEVKPRQYDQPVWDGGAFEGKTLLIHPEQGFGDTIMAARFLPQVKALGGANGRVVLECKTPLTRLFEGVAGIDRLVAPDAGFRDFDLHVSLMSVPGLVGADLTDLPPPVPLSVPQAARDRVAPWLAPAKDRFKIGIVWSGSVTFKGNAKRAVTVDRFLPFACVPGVQVYSLQKGPCEGDLAAAGADSVILPIGPMVDDFAETAAVIDALDLIIMTDSSVAHLAGSLGAEVWNLLPYHPYWIYPVEGERTPWYPSMRMFRQTAPGDWDEVFARAKAELEKKVAARG